jgi:hypothetical protein
MEEAKHKCPYLGFHVPKDQMPLVAWLIDKPELAQLRKRAGNPRGKRGTQRSVGSQVGKPPVSAFGSCHWQSRRRGELQGLSLADVESECAMYGIMVMGSKQALGFARPSSGF